MYGVVITLVLGGKNGKQSKTFIQTLNTKVTQNFSNDFYINSPLLLFYYFKATIRNLISLVLKLFMLKSISWPVIPKVALPIGPIGDGMFLPKAMYADDMRKFLLIYEKAILSL